MVERAELFLAGALLRALNGILRLLERVVFAPLGRDPERILIYKVGNIGDVVCAVPALVAIRRRYPDAHITLLTSPGKKGSVGAQELLLGAWYLDEFKVYYTDELAALKRRRELIRDLKARRYDLFIQLPDDWALFPTLVRNLLFAKLTGARSAIGFVKRTVWLFHRAQVDHTMQPNEVESLLRLLRTHGIESRQVEFDFPVTDAQRKRVDELLATRWVKGENSPLVAVNPGAKLFSKEWPPERFGAVCSSLQATHGARIVFIGGPGDRGKATTAMEGLRPELTLDAAGSLGLLETRELLSRCAFLLSNDTGAVHLAASAGVPVVGLYSVRSVYGKWFPYGSGHEVLYRRFLKCDYRDERCIKASLEAISVEEVMRVCDRVLQRRTTGVEGARRDGT